METNLNTELVDLNSDSNKSGICKTLPIKEILEIIKRIENGERLVDLASIYKLKFTKILYWIKHKEKLIFLFENKLNIKDYEKTLSIQQKLEIINYFEMSENMSAIVNKYFIPATTIKRWVKNKIEFEKSLNQNQIKSETETSILENPEKITTTKIEETFDDLNKSKINEALISNNVELKENNKKIRQYFTIEEKLKAVKSFESGETTGQIADKYNITKSTVTHWIRTKSKFEQPQQQIQTSNSIQLESELKSENSNTVIEEQNNKTSNDSVTISYSKKIDKIRKTEDKLTAVKCYQNGESLVKVATNYNVTPSAILYWMTNQTKYENYLNRNKRKSVIIPKIPLSDKLEAISRYENGETYTYLGSCYNVSRNTIKYWNKIKDRLRETEMKSD